MNRAALGCALAVLVAVAAPASADRAARSDQRDGGAQDIRTIRHGHGRAEDRLIHTVTTHGRWGTRRLACPSYEKCRSSLRMFISTDRDEWYERDVVIYHRDGRLRAQISRYKADKDCGSVSDPTCDDRTDPLGHVPVWRPDSRSVRIAIPAEMLGGMRRGWYEWIAWFWYRRSRPCGSGSYFDRLENEYQCSDYAPDRGYWRHHLD